MKRLTHIIAVGILSGALFGLAAGCGGRSDIERVEQGMRQLEAGNDRAAARNLKRASTRIANSAPLYYNLGTAYFRLGRFEGAAEAFATALEIEPGDAMAREFLGLTFLAQRKWDDARVALNEALAAADASSRARLLNALFLAERGAGRPDMGLIRLLRARRHERRHAPTFYNLASLYRDEYQLYEEAVDLLEMYVRLAPETDAHAAKARESIRRLKTAMPDPDRAAPGGSRRVPAEALRSFNEGEAHRQARRWRQAANAYARAMDLFPMYYEAAFNLGFARSSEGQWREAFAAYQRAGEIDPRRVEPLYMQAREAYVGQDYEAAARLLAWHAIPRWPHYAPNFELMAYVAAALGRHDDARVYGGHFLELSAPSDARARFAEWLRALPR